MDAFPLVTTPESYPVWFSQHPIVVPRGEAISYNYCILEGGKIVSQEQLLNVREVIPRDANTVVNDDVDPDKIGCSTEPSEADIFNSSRGLRSHSSEGDLDWLNLRERNCRLFLVCYHLPVDIRRTENPDQPFEVSWTDSLIAKTDGMVSQSIETFWIGTVSVHEETLLPNEKTYLLSLLAKMNCIPLFLDHELTSSAYYGFCKMVMWPVFHNVDQLDQIHAAWNLPPEYYDAQRSASSGLGGNRSRSSSRVFDSPPGTNNVKVLEWNQHAAAFHAAYCQVNKIFASTILQYSNKGDIVWVHDYHLMFVPSLLRNDPAFELKPLKIVYFLHIPFPTSQIFRTLPQATQLLQSITCADLVGFHAFDHARHFLNACRRMLGHRSHTRPGGMITIDVKDRELIVTMSHVSIETSRIDPIISNPSHLVFQRVEALREKFKGKRVILGIDVCQRLSGVALKLAAFEKFLGDLGSEQARGLILVQKCIRQGSRLEDEETTSGDLRKMVANINHKYGGQSAARSLLSSALSNNSSSVSQVVDYEEINHAKGMNLIDRIALYLIADVFLITPIREGLNLLPLEYIYARSLLPRAGVVVTSEFTTCSSLLNGSLRVNPFSPTIVADALSQALAMRGKDCEYRRQRDLPFIRSHPSSQWTKRILCELEHIESKNGRRRARMSQLPEPLHHKALINAYAAIGTKESTGAAPAEPASRILLFEYGGVLLQKEKFDIYIKQTLSAISGRKPSESLLDCIRRLSEDPANVVVIVTGVTQIKLGETFKGLENVTLATSNGLVYSWAANLAGARSCGVPVPTIAATLADFSSSASRAIMHELTAAEDREWDCMDCNVDWSAVASIAVPIITRFTFRTNGTCQTPRFPGIGWSFFGADPEWGQKQATQLTLELEAALIKHDVKITSLIPGSIEVVPRTLNKGLIVKRVLDRAVEVRGGKAPRLVALVSGEENDDGMTQAVMDMLKGFPSDLERMKVFTVTVGKRESPSQYYVDDVLDVENLLKNLADI